MTSTAVAVATSRLPGLDSVGAAFGLAPGVVQPNGLQLTDTAMTFDEWAACGHVVGAFSRWSRFALGDWLLFGEALYGDDAYQATEATAHDRYDVAHRVTGLQVETLQNYASVCGRIPLPIRRIELSFSAHEPVASLTRDEQVAWLELAVVNGWDRAELRAAIKAAKAQPGDDTEVVDAEEAFGGELTRTERLENAARLVYAQAQPNGNGSVTVPPEPWRLLAEALGDE